jgi:hypothetical protein
MLLVINELAQSADSDLYKALMDHGRWQYPSRRAKPPRPASEHESF